MTVRRALLLAVLAAACSVQVPPPAGEQAQPFELLLLDGTTVALEDLHGKLLVLDFWATWCPPCVMEIPELNAFYATHRDDGVELLAIAIDVADPAKLAKWAVERDIQYPVAVGDVGLARLYGADQFPLHILISPDGRVIERLTPGYHDRDELAAAVARHKQ